MKNAGNKRTSGRAPFSQPVVLEIWQQDAGRSSIIRKEGIGIDRSAGGGKISTAYPLKPGDVVKLFFPIGVMDIRLPVYSTVVWSQATDSGCQAGVTFLS